MSQVHVSVQDGIDFQEFKGRLDGFAAGVAAGVNLAIQARLAQLSKPEPPKEKPDVPTE